MSDVIDRPTLEVWLDHPVVREAFERSERDALPFVFEQLYELLTELDERFPGVPLACIMSAGSHLDPVAVRNQLLAAGASQEDVDLIVPVEGPKPGSKRHALFDALLNPDLTPQDLIDQGFTTSVKAARDLMLLRRPITPIQQRALDLAATGQSSASIARELGTSRQLVVNARRRQAFHQWRAARGGS